MPKKVFTRVPISVKSPLIAAIAVEGAIWPLKVNIVTEQRSATTTMAAGTSEKPHGLGGVDT
jgi:hypothetical protein